jgi:uncharacterized protein (TIGR01777 family)
MNITLSGATGFIGRQLADRLVQHGHRLHLLGRKRPQNLPASIAFSEWDAAGRPRVESLESADAVIHLAGEPIAQRWSAAAKQRIRDSRVEGTANLVDTLTEARQRPGILISGSAIGYYGSRGDEILTETSPPGSDFLARVGVEWEAQARRAEPLGLRVVLIRTAMVLGHGGALQKMLPPFRAGLGGVIGSGHQWMSWIHIDDLVGLILFALDTPDVRGAINGSAPNPIRNAGFTRALASALHRPAIFPVPEFALKVLFGEMSSVLLSSQRVVPEAPIAAGFSYKFPELEPALTHILKRRDAERQ